MTLNNGSKEVIGIVGLGVMGASFAAKLTSIGQTVWGIDQNPHTVQTALEKKIIQKGSTDPKELLSQCQTLILCLYPQAIVSFLHQYQQIIPRGTLIMEISGVKQPIIEQIEQALPKGCEFISIHPMCGKESRGIEHSSGSIFDQSNFLIVQTSQCSDHSLEQAKYLAKNLGCKTISVLTPQVHDQMIAFVSQLTHAIAVSLMNAHSDQNYTDFTGDSFRELTRIAKINEEMWSELFLLNKGPLLQEIENFETSLNLLKMYLKEENEEELKNFFRQSSQKREQFDH